MMGIDRCQRRDNTYIKPRRKRRNAREFDKKQGKNESWRYLLH
jgi:hypothetical protein